MIFLKKWDIFNQIYTSKYETKHEKKQKGGEYPDF